MKYKDYINQVLAKPKYAVVVKSTGQVLLKFRGSNAARYWMQQKQKDYYELLDVVPIEKEH